jgi:hypothetical protein
MIEIILLHELAGKRICKVFLLTIVQSSGEATGKMISMKGKVSDGFGS